MLSTLRHNLLAVLALVVALSGTAYAASLPRNSVGPEQLKAKAVTAAKLKNKAVRSAKIQPGAVNGSRVRDGSLGRSDLASTVFTFVDGGLSTSGDPETAPTDLTSTNAFGQRSVTLPRTGATYVRFFNHAVALTCSAGTARLALYWDDVPVPMTSVTIPAAGDQAARELSAVLTATAGVHQLAARAYCPPGATPGAGSMSPTPSWLIAQP